MFDLGATVCTAQPRCDACPLRRLCAWRRQGAGAPDPWRASPVSRPQSAFAGSDRQGRGRLLDALRRGPVRPGGAGRGLRVARGPGPGATGGGRSGRRGLRPLVRRQDARPRVGRGGAPAEAARRQAVRKRTMCALTTSGAFDVEEVPGVVDDLHGGAFGQEGERVGADGRQQHAVVVAPVQVQGGLGRGQQRRRLLVGQLGHLQLGLVERAVVADGGEHVLGIADRLLDPGHVPAAVVARRPVGPEVVDEGIVVQRERRLGQGGEEEEHVPAALQLGVGQQRHADGHGGGHGRRHGTAPAVGLRAPPRRRSPWPPSRGRR